MSFFKVSIYTPSKVLAKDIQAKELIIPTSRGEINVLPEHTHLITNLGTGIITLVTESGDKNFSSTAGICKILKDQVTILSTTSEASVDIDRERAQKALEVAKKKLSGEEMLTEEELLKYQRKMNRAELRLKMGLLGKD